MTSTSVNDLPDEVLEFIFGHLPPYRDLESCALVCKRWTNIVRSELKKNCINVIEHIENERKRKKMYSSINLLLLQMFDGIRY